MRGQVALEHLLSDHKAGNHKEDIDSDEATFNNGGEEMAGNYQKYGQGAQALNILTVLRSRHGYLSGLLQ
jgi:hypothetical protein